MKQRYRPADLSRLRLRSVTARGHKSSTRRAAGLPPAGASAADLIASFPDYLGATAFRRVVEAVVVARKSDRPVAVAFGAHVLKVGCGPILVDLIRRGIVQALCCNGAVAIHDMELAAFGETSEEVSETIRDGSFGMVKETLSFFVDAVAESSRRGVGLGEAVGRLLLERFPESRQSSVLAAAADAGVAVTVHVAVGTDTVHVAPDLDGASLGAASLADFRLLCDVVADLGAKDAPGVGGVWLNVGSAVILPEVFLKAVSVARNLGANLDAMTTANFDMIRHYRPHANVVTRPVTSGRGFEIVGQHEILLPLFRQAVIEGLAVRPS